MKIISLIEYVFWPVYYKNYAAVGMWAYMQMANSVKLINDSVFSQCHGIFIVIALWQNLQVWIGDTSCKFCFVC